MTADPPAPPAMSLLDGRFVLRRRLGSGGYSTVYEAFDHKRNAVVALKIPNVEIDGDSLYRFKNEFRSLADLTDPHLVTLYELHASGTQWFFTMELVEGRDFLSYLRPNDSLDAAHTPGYQTGSASGLLPLAFASERFDDVAQLEAGPNAALPAPATIPPSPLPPEQLPVLCELLLQLADGLLVLHRAGKLHRDLKPSNVLCTPEQRLVLLDFGLVLDVKDASAGAKNAMGTLGYMAPETAAGAALTTASDWYSVGVMIYEALVGRRPFDGREQLPGVLLRRPPFDTLPPPSTLVSHVPADLEALCLDLLRPDPAARPLGSEVRERLARLQHELGLQPRSYRRASSPDLITPVGRASELAQLDAALAQSRAGNTVVVLCQGRSGMGKTLLVEHFLSRLKPSHPEHAAQPTPPDAPVPLILEGRCYQQESVPFCALDGVIDNLTRYLQKQPRQDVEQLIPRDGFALRRLFPVLRQIPAFAMAYERPIADASRLLQAASWALHELLCDLAARGPLVVFIDDFHWGDRDSLTLLGDVLQDPKPPPFLLIIAHRQEESERNPVLQDLFALLRTASNNHVKTVPLELGELAPAAATSLAQALGPEGTEPSWAETIAREAAGHPFLVVELARHCLETGQAATALPSTIGAVLAARIADLPRSARHMLEVVAAAGEPIARDSVRRVLQEQSEAAADEPKALALLRAGRFIRIQPGDDNEELVCYHDRIRETVLAALSPDHRAGLQLRLALVLSDVRNTPPEQLAHLFREAGRLHEATHYAIEAAHAAARALAFHQAAQLYRFALELGTLSAAAQSQIYGHLGDTLEAARRLRDAADAYLAAAPAASLEESLEYRRKAAELWFFTGRADDALALLLRLLREVGVPLPTSTWRLGLALALLRVRLWWRGTAYDLWNSRETLAPLELARIDICWSAAVTMSLHSALGSALLQSRQALLALDLGEPTRVARALATEGLFSAFTARQGRTSQATALLDRAAALAERIDDPHGQAHVALNRGLLAQLEGQWKRSETELLRAERLLKERCHGMNFEFNPLYAALTNCRWQLGELAILKTETAALLADARERNDPFTESVLLLMGEFPVQLAADRPAQAQAAMEQAMVCCPGKGAQLQRYSEAAAHVRLALYRGQGRAAWQAATVQWAHLVRLGAIRFASVRVDALSWYALAALADETAATHDARQRRLTWIVRQLKNEHLATADGLAKLIQAALHMRQGRSQEALLLCQAAETELLAANLRLIATAAARCRGQWMGGREGQALMASADAWMTEQGVVRPAAMAAVVAPGRRDGFP